jgi:NADH-quinone oxidoreductase subunit E
MLCKCNEEPVKLIEKKEPVDLKMAYEILADFDEKSSNLITLLQEIQSTYGFLSEEVLELIAVETGIKEAKIYGVATFYTQFRMKPIGKHLIMVCKGTACHVNGAAKIEAAVKECLDVEEGDITADGLFTYITVACLGCCSLAPVMMVDEHTHAKLTPASVKTILEGYRNEVAV